MALGGTVYYVYGPTAISARTTTVTLCTPWCLPPERRYGRRLLGGGATNRCVPTPPQQRVRSSNYERRKTDPPEAGAHGLGSRLFAFVLEGDLHFGAIHRNLAL